MGSFLLPNNLSANAHGNGYADPNIIVPAIIESVQTDGGAFNVREGNHSVDLAATYGLRPSLDPFATLTADYRDVDLSAGWKWLALQASYGNGFLDTLEHRQQYKINALNGWDLGRAPFHRACSSAITANRGFRDWCRLTFPTCTTPSTRASATRLTPARSL